MPLQIQKKFHQSHVLIVLVHAARIVDCFFLVHFRLFSLFVRVRLVCVLPCDMRHATCSPATSSPATSSPATSFAVGILVSLTVGLQVLKIDWLIIIVDKERQRQNERAYMHQL